MTAEQDRQNRRKQEDQRESSRPQTETEQERLEALLLDEQQRAGSVDGVAQREIRAVKPQRSGRAGRWLTVLGLVMFMGVLGFLGLQPQTPLPMQTQSQQEIVRRPMPERPHTLPAEAAEEGKSQSPSVKKDNAAVNEPKVKPLLETTVSAPSAETEPAEETNREARLVPQEEAPPQQLYQVTVGPFITAAGLDQARELLRNEGLKPEAVPGTGPVAMIRLREGRYRGEQGQQRLTELKGRLASAFLLPEEGKQVLYLGSFRDPERALQLQRELARDNIEVSQVTTRLIMDGTLLLVEQADRETAEQLAERLEQRGLIARVSEDQ